MRALPLLFLFMVILDVTAQETNSAPGATDSTGQTLGDEIFLNVDTPSMPVGGYEAFYNYIGTNLQYPKEARVSKITGKVIIEFVVEKDGSISQENIKVLKSPHKSLSTEAIRLITNAPKWVPGKQNNIPVRTKKVFPISFRLG